MICPEIIDGKKCGMIMEQIGDKFYCELCSYTQGGKDKDDTI